MNPIDGRPACPYYLRGYCAFGNRCRRWHPQQPPATREHHTIPAFPNAMNEYAANAEEEVDLYLGRSDCNLPLVSPNCVARDEANTDSTMEAENLREEDRLSEEPPEIEEEGEVAVLADDMKGTPEPLAEQLSVCERAPEEDRVDLSNRDGEIAPELNEDSVAADSCNDAAVDTLSDPTVEVGDVAEGSTNETRATQATKKSRLLMRREARKTRKALRKKTLKQILGEEDGGADAISDEVIAKNDDSSPEATAEEETPTAAVKVAVDETRDVIDVDTGRLQESFDEVRVMTKRERKREERRQATVMKKRERQERKRREESERRCKRRLQAEEGKNLLEEGKHLEAALAFSKAMNGPDSTPEEEADLYLGRSECHLAMDKVSCALRDSRKAVGLWDDDRSLRWLLKLETLCGMTAEARLTCGRLSPSTNTAAYLESIGKIETAIAEFEQLSADGLWKGADKEIRTAAEFAPHSVTVLLGRAEVCMHLHIFDEGRELIREAKRISGNEDDCGFLYVRGLDMYYTEEFWRDADKEPAVLRAFAKTRNWKKRAMTMYHKAAAIKSRFLTVQILLNEGAKKERAKMNRNNIWIKTNHCQLPATQIAIHAF